MFRSQNKLPQKVCFGELYRTAETNSKRTSFQPDFVRNDIISVRSSISFEVYRGLKSRKSLSEDSVWVQITRTCSASVNEEIRIKLYA